MCCLCLLLKRFCCFLCAHLCFKRAVLVHFLARKVEAQANKRLVGRNSVVVPAHQVVEPYQEVAKANGIDLLAARPVTARASVPAELHVGFFAAAVLQDAEATLQCQRTLAFRLPLFGRNRNAGNRGEQR